MDNGGYYTIECKEGCWVLDNKEEVADWLDHMKKTYKNDTYGLIDMLFDAKLSHIENGKVVKETNIL